MDIQPGELLICWDKDLKDAYLVEAVEAHDTASAVFPLVRILRVLKYPIQHAIMHPDVASENLPYKEKDVCRMAYMEHTGTTLLSIYHSFEESMNMALEAAIAQAESENDTAALDILRRHQEGHFKTAGRKLAKGWEHR